MSDETKNKSAAETVAENVQAIARGVADNAASVEDVAAASSTIATAPANGAKKGKGKQKIDPAEMAEKLRASSAAAEKAASALKAVGEAACAFNKLTRVWVTSDGQAFAQEGDAKAHAKNLPSKEILKVSAK